jgi:hypothetical protein
MRKVAVAAVALLLVLGSGPEVVVKITGTGPSKLVPVQAK